MKLTQGDSAAQPGQGNMDAHWGWHTVSTQEIQAFFVISSTGKGFLSFIQHTFVECLVYANSQAYGHMPVAEGWG